MDYFKNISYTMCCAEGHENDPAVSCTGNINPCKLCYENLQQGHDDITEITKELVGVMPDSDLLLLRLFFPRVLPPYALR